MCTVTFLPLKDKFFITSNRDEQKLREIALPPVIKQYTSGKILYPVDGRSLGTWIAAHENGNVMVLLNGAFKRHIPEPPYKKSRGLVFLDIFDATYPSENFQSMDLSGIEPFTLVLWEFAELWEFRWDGVNKFEKPLPVNAPQLWASATLYDEHVIANREHWFKEWLSEREIEKISMTDIKHFHEFGGNGDVRNDLRMNRDGLLLTVSITAMEWHIDRTVMQYKDLITNTVSINAIP